jgi:hypothetical protein
VDRPTPDNTERSHFWLYDSLINLCP